RVLGQMYCPIRYLLVPLRANGPFLALSSLVLPSHPPLSTLFPYATLFRSHAAALVQVGGIVHVRVSSRTLPGYPRKVLEETRTRSEEHTSELQSRENLVCRLLLEKKKQTHRQYRMTPALQPSAERTTPAPG